MGAGVDPKLWRRRKYDRLKTIQRKLEAKGVPCIYNDLEVRGDIFVIYFAECGPASNGERMAWAVLRYNEQKTPNAYKRSIEDVDYSNFHTCNLSFENGMRKVENYYSDRMSCVKV